MNSRDQITEALLAADAPELAAYRTRRRYPGAGRAAEPTPDVLDTFQSMPRGALAGLANSAVASGRAAAAEMGQPAEQPSDAEALALLEGNVTGPLHRPQTPAGEVGADIGQVMGNPANWIAGGSLPYVAGFNALAGIGRGLGQQMSRGTPYEPYASIAGGWSPAAAERLLPALARVR
jgi:hypothetical protein